MSLRYKKLFLIIGAIFFFLILAGIQIAFINASLLKINLFLIWIIYLVLTKKNIQAIILAWCAGIFLDLVHFSVFGTSSLALLILVGILISAYNIAFLRVKSTSVVAIGVIGVISYYLLNWLIIGAVSFLKNNTWESLGFYFINYSFVFELAATIIISSIIFRKSHV